MYSIIYTFLFFFLYNTTTVKSQMKLNQSLFSVTRKNSIIAIFKWE